MLLVKELSETLREETEGVREETEEEKEVFREAPAIDVALTAALTGRELGGAGAGLGASPARSTSVLRFKLLVPGGGGSIDEDRTLLTDAETSSSLPGDGIRLGWRSCEVNCGECQSPPLLHERLPYRVLVEVHCSGKSKVSRCLLTHNEANALFG